MRAGVRKELPGRHAPFWLGSYMVAFGAAAITFRLVPDMDLAIATWFVLPDGEFALREEPLWQFVSAFQVAASSSLVILSFACLAIGIGKRQHILRLPLQFWVFVPALYVFGPGAIVNLFLKRVSGRARPDTVATFGGEREFTPAWTISDQCQTNCSFVSAEVASAVALAFSLVLASRISGSKGWTTCAILALCLVPLVVLQRLGSGRHFFSDALFAILIIAGLGQMLWIFAVGAKTATPARNVS